ncbi:hypothetical protein [Azotobacter chroococcum]|uniref:hypothetical protein n=1 Tax=Azotobacter chroococcum TaxID=353 RepID=UPI0010AEA984|nr:hypothetical protein [Azotobacter chroococcum]TKD46940.1 hypothetical protein FCG41_01045 [Azotobacter chroococcum]
MAEAANKHFFSEPHWRVIAQGFQTETWFNDSQAVGTGGIRNPQPISLPTGNYYYRFASSNSSRETQLGGGWWLDFENYRKIQTFAQQHGYSIRDAARLMLALPYAWTRVDLIIKALLAVPMKAYAGEGKPAQGANDGPDRGTIWIPTQHIKICQLYIPGLFVKCIQPREQLYEKVFSSLVTERVFRMV